MFTDRIEAGQKLAARLEKYRKNNHTLVVSLTRGGVKVGAEVAGKLRLPMDILIVRKIGMPGNPEYAIGALSEYGEVVLDNEVIRSHEIPWEYIEEQIDEEKDTMRERKSLFEPYRTTIDLKGKTVLLVDDGLATGHTMKAALADMRKKEVEKIIVAVPVGPKETIQEMQKMADTVISLEIPEFFFAVGHHYENFDQVENEEVIELLQSIKKQPHRN